MKGAQNAHTVKSSSTLLRKEATEAVGRLLPLILHLKLWYKTFSKLSLFNAHIISRSIFRHDKAQAQQRCWQRMRGGSKAAPRVCSSLHLVEVEHTGIGYGI